MVDLGTIRGRVSLDIRQAVASYAALRAQNAKTVYALRGTGDSLVATGRGMMVAGAGFVYAFGKAVSAAAEFERKMDYFGAVTDTNAGKMQKLNKYTLMLAQNTIYSANEIADGFVELGKAGVNADQIMRGVGKAMASLGAAGDIPLTESGQIITSVVSQFGLKAGDAVKVADLLAGAANASIADITDLGYSLKYVGGIAHTAGLSFDDVTTALSVLAKAGIRGSTAGTTLRQMIVSLPGTTDKATAALKDLGIITQDGTNRFYDQRGELKPLSQVYQILGDSMKGMTAEQKTNTLRTIFQTRALSAASVLMRAGTKGFKDMNKAMKSTTAMEVAHKRLDNLSGDLEILRGNIETLVIQAGGPFQETLRGWVRSLTKLVQAFGKLDPKTQKLIMQTIAVTGVTLLAMGAFNIIVGSILKFIAHSMKLWAGLKMLANIMKIVWTNSRWLVTILGGELAGALGVTTGVLLIIIAAVLAFIAVWVLAYKKIDIFRNAVNAWYGTIWKAIKAFGAFIKLLATDPGAAWDKIKHGADVAFQAILNWAKKIPGWLKSGLSKAAQEVSNFVGKVVEYLKSLPGKALGVITSFVSQVISLLTFRNAGYVLGYLLGTVVRIFVTLGARAIALTARMVTGVINFVKTLPGKIGYFIGFMVGRAVGLMIRLQAKMIGLMARAVAGVVRFVASLPGKVINFVASMVARTVGFMVNLAHDLPRLASEAVHGIINFVQQLPGKMAEFFSNAVSRARGALAKLPGIAIQFAQGAYNGIRNTLMNLPGIVWEALGAAITMFKSMVTSAYNAAKDFAGGLWKGFKDGIGMHSPSHIERAMWQIGDTMDVELKKMRKKTLDVQKLSRDMAKTSFTVGDPGAPSGITRYARLASMHRANQNRARMLQDPSRKLSVRDARRNDQRATHRGKAELEITNWHQGKGYMKGIAQDTIDDDYDYSDTLGRMR